MAKAIKIARKRARRAKRLRRKFETGRGFTWKKGISKC